MVLADAVDEETHGLIPVAPRTILRRQLERASALGYRPKLATELEYYLLQGSYEQLHDGGFQQLKPSGWYNEDYHLLQSAKTEPFHRQLRNGMAETGIPIEGSKGEASPGQHEVNLRYADAL